MAETYTLKNIIENAIQALTQEMDALKIQNDSLSSEVSDLKYKNSLLNNNIDRWEETIIDLRTKLAAVYATDPGKKAMSEEVQRFVNQHKPIEAIKYVRSVTNWGFKEAKDFVDTFKSDVPF